MRAIVITEPGGPDVLALGNVPDPQPGAGEVVVDVAAAGVNRADMGQRRGVYPPPAGASPLLGLECAGRVTAVGEDVTDIRVGDSVMALLTGGGYAERVAVPAAQVMPAAPALSMIENGALPETCCTVHSMVFNGVLSPRPLQPGEALLVHGGASGIGTTAIQLAKAYGATVVTTVGSDAKAELCQGLGADIVVNYRETDFAEVVRDQLGGVDVILDVVGASYLRRNLLSLRTGGRIAVIGQMGGSSGEIDFGLLQPKRAIIHAAGLRARPDAEKAEVVSATWRFIEPIVAAGKLRPVIDRVFALEDASAAHERVERGDHVGKVMLGLTGC
jgi:putative PIG3 family NAD(P)H quinone oxidoreductase